LPEQNLKKEEVLIGNLAARLEQAAEKCCGDSILKGHGFNRAVQVLYFPSALQRLRFAFW
jgi:hypothetical protein